MCLTLVFGTSAARSITCFRTVLALYGCYRFVAVDSRRRESTLNLVMRIENGARCGCKWVQLGRWLNGMAPQTCVGVGV